MAPRACQPTRKKVLVWVEDRTRETDIAGWLDATGYETCVYPDVHDIVAVCAAEMPNLIILRAGSAGLIDRLDEDSKSRRIPVLLISDDRDPPTGISVSRACLTDWMPAPVTESDLIVKVKAMLRVAYTESLSPEPPERDSLTKLYNRRYFDDRLQKEIERARRYGRKLTCVMMDVDNFQGLNDTYGHCTGDLVLRALGDALLSSTRCSDIISRYGGEEFALLLPETMGSDARMLAERIRLAFSERPFESKGAEFSVSLSCGVASYPDHARDAETLVRMANSAIFQAKSEGGGGTFVAFSESEREEDGRICVGPTILIVEDNDYNRSVASLVLRASGYEVLEAGDGATAFSLVRDEHPDLILVDIQLSGCDGLDATRGLIDMDENRNVPIVALTAGNVPDDLEELVKAGCRGYIVKPIDTNNLAVQIQSYLDA